MAVLMPHRAATLITVHASMLLFSSSSAAAASGSLCCPSGNGLAAVVEQRVSTQDQHSIDWNRVPPLA